MKMNAANSSSGYRISVDEQVVRHLGLDPSAEELGSVRVTGPRPNGNWSLSAADPDDADARPLMRQPANKRMPLYFALGKAHPLRGRKHFGAEELDLVQIDPVNTAVIVFSEPSMTRKLMKRTRGRYAPKKKEPANDLFANRPGTPRQIVGKVQVSNVKGETLNLTVEQAVEVLNRQVAELGNKFTLRVKPDGKLTATRKFGDD